MLAFVSVGSGIVAGTRRGGEERERRRGETKKAEYYVDGQDGGGTVAETLRARLDEPNAESGWLTRGLRRGGMFWELILVMTVVSGGQWSIKELLHLLKLGLLCNPFSGGF